MVFQSAILLRLCHNLSKKDYIKTLKGKGGGIRLLKEPQQINLRDLIIDIEPNLHLVECFDKEK